MTEELVNDKGERLIIAVQGKFDGQDYPVKGTPFADTVSYRLLDPHTIEGVAKKSGRVCVRETAVLSQNRHVIRVTYLSYDERGNTHISHGVFERIDLRRKDKRRAIASPKRGSATPSEARKPARGRHR
jgi:hypothetical protein